MGLAGSAATAIFLLGCGRPKVIRIALAGPLTGDYASFGQGLLRACRLAVEEQNAKGGLPMPLEVVPFDDRGDPKEAVTVAKRISSDRAIVVVIGHFNSGCTIPAGKVYGRYQIPMITPAASNPRITRQQMDPEELWVKKNWPRNLFRVNPTDDVQGAWGATYAYKKLGKRKVAILHVKNAYGEGVAMEFEKKWKELGGKVLTRDGIPAEDRDFKALLTKVKGMRPDLLYFGGEVQQGGLIARQAREVGIPCTILMSEANKDAEFFRLAGDAADGVLMTFLGSPPEQTPEAGAFLQKYRQKYPKDEVKAFDHYGYEATSMACEAIRAVGPDRAKVREYLRTIRYEGILGETRFDEKGDTLNQRITLFKASRGRFLPVSS